LRSREGTGVADSSCAPPRRIVVDATAGMSGGRVYLNELLPKIVESLAGTDWIVYGNLTPELKAVAAHNRVRFLRPWFPQPTTSLILAGLAKLCWREIVLPFKLARLRPCLLLTTANFASPLLSRLGIPVVIGLHNLLPFHQPQWYTEPSLVRRLRQDLLLLLTVWSARRVARTIAFSGYAKTLLCKSRVDPAHVTVIHHGISPATLHWSAGDSDTVLLVSHYFAYKNIDVAIRAMPRVQAATGRRIRLLVQGVPYDRRYYKHLAELVRSLGLEESVSLGRGVAKEELDTLYASSECLIFPAIGENCPITLLEAMSAGIPIVAADADPLPEICGDAAIYYQTFDERACADAIVRVLGDNEAARALSLAGGRRAATDFTWEACARKTADVLRLAWQE
jgi:glycosyltransferase involved in cell wall biosynthesis